MGKDTWYTYDREAPAWNPRVRRFVFTRYPALTARAGQSGTLPFRWRHLGIALLALVGGWAGTGAAAHAEDWVYAVRPGDNLWSLTQRHLKHLGYVSRLQAVNQVADPYRLPPGTRLRIPLVWARRRPGIARVVSHGGSGTLPGTAARAGRHRRRNRAGRRGWGQHAPPTAT